MSKIHRWKIAKVWFELIHGTWRLEDRPFPLVTWSGDLMVLELDHQRERQLRHLSDGVPYCTPAPCKIAW